MGAPEKFSVEKVSKAIAIAKYGKAAVFSGAVADMLKVPGKEDAEWVADICNAVMKDGRISKDWKECI